MSEPNSLLRFDRNELTDKLRCLSDKKRLAFALTCCERLVPNYRKFQSETKWGDIGLIESLMDQLWKAAAGSQVGEQELAELSRQCEACAPDADDFDSLYVSSAQDACLAMCQVFDYVHDQNLEHLTQAASYAIDSVDLYVQETENMQPNTEDLEGRILAHPLMQNEIKKQAQAITQLADIGQDDRTAWERFEMQWRGLRQGCLDA